MFVLRGGGVDVGGTPLLRDVDLHLRPGSCHALIGPSGAGKTSLLRALCGLDSLASGTLTLAGESPAAIGWPVFRRRVGLAAQRPLMLAGSVADNLAVAFEFASARRRFDRARAAASLERLGLRGVLDQRAADLSVGEQQRVSLVRSSLLEPEVWLLDEPTSALDPAAVRAVEGWLRERCTGGAAVLLVSHDRAQLDRLADLCHDLEAWRAGGLDG